MFLFLVAILGFKPRMNAPKALVLSTTPYRNKKPAKSFDIAGKKSKL